MQKTVLITGGAGFIGSHVADELLAHGYHVRALDSLCSQVHGDAAGRPEYLNSDIELTVGDVENPDDVERALKGVDCVYHFAARVGVGQSMYEIRQYMQANSCGTATLLEALAKHPIERLIVASSMSIYGEGLYQTADGKKVWNAERSIDRLRAGEWELHSDDGEELTPIPTPEEKTPSLASVYALSKFDQESLCLMMGAAYQLPTVALRFFNVYGPRQALSNPYTGVLAIFASRLLNNKPPMIFEDGLQRRDLVSVYDVALACRLALEAPDVSRAVLNVGSGVQYTICELAERIAKVLGREDVHAQITNRYRHGDIRHCVADIAKAHRLIGFQPRVKLEDGLADLASWLEGRVPLDHVDQAAAELAARGLTV